MGTIGLNFGSATSGAGFDVASTVNSILGIQQAIETPEKSQLASLQAQDSVFTSLGSDLSTLSTSLQALTGFDGVLAEKQGSSSDTNVLTLTNADSTAVAGSHTVVVTSLASTSSKYSYEIANASDTLSGSFTISVGGGPTHTITVDATSNTLATLASAINQSAIGVNASVITDANGSRLSLVSSTSGSSGNIAITGDSLLDSTANTAIGFTTGQSGANASLTVDGQPVSSASNTVTGAIPGVTFQLLSQAPGTPVQIQVTNDNAAVETAVSNLVTAYNAVVKDIAAQEKNTSAGTPEPLYGSPTLSLIQSQLQGALFSGSASGSINSITQLGLATNSDGTLSLDNSALDSALNNHFSDINGFLQNSSSFGQTFASVLNGLGSQAPNGAIYLAQQQNSTQESSIQSTISKQDAAIADERTSLTSELNIANEELQAIPQQLSEIDQIYSAISGYNQQK